MSIMESLWRLKRFDAFPKTLEDFRVKTCGGAFGEGLPAVRGLQDSEGCCREEDKRDCSCRDPC